jgi:hypothetical protein
MLSTLYYVLYYPVPREATALLGKGFDDTSVGRVAWCSGRLL